MKASTALIPAGMAVAAFFLAQPLQLLAFKASPLGALAALINPPRNSSSFHIQIAADGTQRAKSTVEVLCTPHAPGAIPGRSCSPPLHIHADQAEYLEVKSGAFGFHVAGKDRAVLRPGDEPITVGARVPHYFWNENAGEEGVLFATFEGVGNVEMFFGEAVEIKTMATI